MSRMHQGKLEALMADYTISPRRMGMTIITLSRKTGNRAQMLSSIQIHLLPDLSATREVVMNEPSGD